MAKRIVRVAIAQAAPVFLDLDKSVEKAVRLTGEAAGKGARLVAFGETWLPGYPAWLDLCPGSAYWDHPPAKRAYARLVENSAVIPGPETGRLCAAAREHAVVLVIGIHRIGTLICWEHWMPLARQAMHESAEEIHVAAWPTVRDMYQVASRHYAFEGRCFVLAAGSITAARDLPPDLELPPELKGKPDALVCAGGSCIIAPDGALFAGPVFDREEILVADLDLGRIAEESMVLDVTGHYNRPDVFQFSKRVVK